MRVLKGLRDVNAVVNHLRENSDFLIGKQAVLFRPSICGSKSGVCTHRVIKVFHRLGGRRGAGKEVMIEFAARLTEASHVGMDGWKAGESLSKDLVEGWFSGSRKASMLHPWLHWRMNNRTEGGKFDSFVKRDAFLFQVCGGDLRHEFVVRKRHAPCE